VVDSGRWLRGGNEVVIGRQLARDKGLHVGDTLRLNGATFSIVGVGLLRGFSSFGQNSVVYMDLRTLVQHAPVGNVVNVVAVATSLVFGWAINVTVAAQYGLESLFRVDSSLLMLIFGLAAALGVVSGVAPARKAASVDPVEVLREI